NAIGSFGNSVRTQAASITANGGNGGVFVTEQDGASFTASATGSGSIGLTSLSGTLTVGGAITTGSGSVTLSSGDGVAVNANVNAGSGQIAINANTDGAGNEGYVQTSPASLSTSNANA